MLDKLYEMVEYFKDHELVFWYNGPISQILLVEIGNLIKKTIENSSDKKVINRIFSILVEQMQNIIKYSLTETSAIEGKNRFVLRSGLIAVGIENENYSVVCCNAIKKDDVSYISNRLDHIIAMNKEDRKEYYKTMRRQEPDERSLGAGLGFIEMARKASEPLQYQFTDIDDKYSYFALKALVKMEL